jgi:hypothetical protein
LFCCFLLCARRGESCRGDAIGEFAAVVQSDESDKQAHMCAMSARSCMAANDMFGQLNLFSFFFAKEKEVFYELKDFLFVHTGNEPPLPESQSMICKRTARGVCGQDKQKQTTRSLTLLIPGALRRGPMIGKLRKKPTTTGKKSLCSSPFSVRKSATTRSNKNTHPNKLMNPNVSINTPKKVYPLMTINTPTADQKQRHIEQKQRAHAKLNHNNDDDDD